MAHRRSKIDLVSPPPSIASTPDTLRIKLHGEYREAAGLSHVEAILSSDRGFYQITSFRPERGFSRNDELSPYVVQAMRDATGDEAVGGFWLIAYWSEKDPTQSERLLPDEPRPANHSLEYSWLLLQPKKVSNEDWLLAARLVAERYGQTAVIWRADGQHEATVYGADETRWATLQSPSSMLSAMRQLTFLRARNARWSRHDFEALACNATGAPPPSASAYAVLPALEHPTDVGPEAIRFYAAVPHCNSTSMFFAALNVHRGG